MWDTSLCLLEVPIQGLKIFCGRMRKKSKWRLTKERCFCFSFVFVVLMHWGLKVYVIMTKNVVRKAKYQKIHVHHSFVVLMCKLHDENIAHGV
jgi:hypothetical protein